VTAQAQRLLERHALRSSDAVQLASAPVLGRELGAMPSLVSFDEALVAAGKAEDLALLP
jgi:hypothetical protein